jgi:hypothetical protein
MLSQMRRQGLIMNTTLAIAGITLSWWRRSVTLKKAWSVPSALRESDLHHLRIAAGTSGYRAFLKAISNPKHPEHESLLVWAGGEFDPERFDLDKVNGLLAKIR